MKSMPRGFCQILALIFLISGLGVPLCGQHPAINESDKFAWELFAEISQPADARLPNGPVAWEGWALASDVFEDPYVAPTWPEQAGRRNMKMMESRPLQQVIRDMQMQGKRPAPPSQRKLRIDPGVVQRHGNETRMNRASFDFVVSNDLFYLEGQEAFFNKGLKIDFPIEAREIKAQWRRLDDPSSYTRYHTSKVDNNGRQETWGLTALHITTKDLPNWFWATFEHIDNEGKEGVVPSVDQFGKSPSGDPSSELLALFRSKKLGSKWQNYVLRGSQVDFVDSIGRPTILANSQIERGFESTSSCITCHARASIGPKPEQSFDASNPQDPDESNRLGVFETRAPLLGSIGTPEPGWFVDLSTNPAAKKFTQTDFVWSLFRAKRRNKFPQPTGSVVAPVPQGSNAGNIPGAAQAAAQQPGESRSFNKKQLDSNFVILKAGKNDAKTRSGVEFGRRLRLLRNANRNDATIEVTYNGFTPEAQLAFQAAVNVWESILETSVPITVNANWVVLDANVLGSAAPAGVSRDFTGAPTAGTWYPIALANKLTGSDLLPDSEDINCNFNSDNADWYFGIDGNTPVGKYDLMSVVLHELGHGLGFSGTARVDRLSPLGRWSFGDNIPNVYDRFIENSSGQSVLSTSLFPNPSTQLANFLTGGNLRFDGANATVANGGVAPPIFAPNPFEGGSSYSHLDESTYPAGNTNSLMTPQLDRAEAIHSPGPIGIGVLADLGWTFNSNARLVTTNASLGCCGDVADAQSPKNRLMSVMEVAKRDDGLNAGRFVEIKLADTDQKKMIENAFAHASSIADRDDPEFYRAVETTLLMVKAKNAMPSATRKVVETRSLTSPFRSPRPPVKVAGVDKFDIRNSKTYQANFKKWFDKQRPNRLRVFGGAPATVGELEHCVAVGNSGFCCTGTLVSPNVVITAAHCVAPGCLTEGGKVYFGINSNDPSTGKVVEGKVYPHPEYNPFTSLHDIAVIILDDEVDVKPCRIATTAEVNAATSLTLAGFGLTELGMSGRKMVVDVIVSSINCNMSLDQTTFGCLDGREIVAGGLGFDSCNGDSGGPAYIDVGGDLCLAGATSRAAANSIQSCGDGGVYVRIDEELEWIKSTVESNGGTLPRVESEQEQEVPAGSKAPRTKR